jgi:hypothetical protein
MSRRAELPEALAPEPFSVEDAQELGIGPSRLRSQDFHRPFRGVRSLSEAAGTLGLCRAYAPIMQRGQFFSHLTAARLYGFPLPPRLQSSDLLDVWAETVQAKTAGVIGHRSNPVPFRLVEGLPVVDPRHVLVQIADQLGHDYLVAAGDYLVRRKLPLETIGTIHDVVRESGGVRGIRALRHAMRQVRPGTDSPMETKLRLVLVRGGLREPVIGHTITTEDGAFIGTPDLAYIPERIAIEYEGDGHRTDRRVFQSDIERRELMQEQHWYVIRVVSSHLYPNPAWLINRVRQQLILRAPRRPSNAL